VTDARILVVGCGFPQLGLLRFCRAEDLHVIGLDLNPEAVGRSECDDFVTASTTDVKAIAAAVSELGATGLTTCGSDHAVLPTARAAEKASKPFYLPSETIAAALHKDDMRARFAQAGAPSPAHRIIRDTAQARVFAIGHGLPVVVKPARGWGQRGVRVVREMTELVAAVEQSLDAAQCVMDDPRCVLERFVEGREFSVDAYTLGGETEVLAVTERIITEYPEPPGITFAEVHPPQVPEAERTRIVEAALAGLAALGVDRGPSYTQVRSGPEGAFIVETALRLGGGLDPDVTFLASGVSLYRKIVGVALGSDEWERCSVEAPGHAGATGRFIIGKPGLVRAVRNLDEARQMPGIVGAEVYVRPGGQVFPLTDGSKRAGHVLAVGDSREAAERHAFAAMDRIEIETVEVS